jgi:hypothetical protein
MVGLARFGMERGGDLTPVERRKVEQELKQLRARGGLTEARVREVAPLLRRLAELEARRREQALGAVGFVIWGLQTLDERGATEPLKIGALRSAYGIDIARLLPNNLSKRREAYGDALVSQAEAQWIRQHGIPAADQQRAELERYARSAWRNPDTLNTWEDEVIPELAEVLIATALGRDPTIQRMPGALPRRPTRFPSNDLTYIFTGEGAVRHVYVVREVEALHDGVDQVEVSHSYYEDSGPEVLSFETHTNCRLTAPVRVMPSRYAHARLNIPPLARRGDRLRISYCVRVKTSVRSRPVLKTTPRNDQDSYVIRVQFDSAYRPRRLWTCHDITDPEIPWSGSQGSEIVTLSSLGYAEARFSNLVRGLTYGLVWEWPHL